MGWEWGFRRRVLTLNLPNTVVWIRLAAVINLMLQKSPFFLKAKPRSVAFLGLAEVSVKPVGILSNSCLSSDLSVSEIREYLKTLGVNKANKRVHRRSRFPAGTLKMEREVGEIDPSEKHLFL